MTAKTFWTVALLGVVVLGAVAASQGGSLAFAETADEVSAMQDEIARRKATIDDINRKLDTYRAKIREYSSKSATLLSDIAMIENQVAMAELDIAATQNEIESQNLEIMVVEERISDETARLERQRAMLSALLFTLHQQADRGAFASVLTAGSFHAAFDAVTQLEEVNAGIDRAVDATKQTRENLEVDKAEHELELATLVDLQTQLEERVTKLDMQRAAKEVLATQTASSEAEYRTLMSELRQEQQYIASQVAALQSSIEDKIAKADLTGDASVLTWPLTGVITALFHDPSYPYRHLFEHSGLDIAVPVGTSVGAAAPGYVAWATTGRQYGNYVMIIHANGMATLYAHLMRIDVATDQFVARSQQIGLSGGKPGMQGAGLSTGPHLHFEVRKNGIPVNPQSYLVE